MKLSYGFIETRGFIASVEAADAMVKAAKVEIIKWRKVGGALVTVFVQGDLDACQAAVDAGKAAAMRVGDLVSAHVIPRPFPDIEEQVIEITARRGKGKKSVVEKASKAQFKKPRTKAPKAVESIEPTEAVIRLLEQKPAGLTLKEISQATGKDNAHTRKLLKGLMDDEKVEKVQQRYFLIKKGKKR